MSALSTVGEAKWSIIVNLSNSIIGVSILAMPFCLKECGLFLGLLMILLSNFLTRLSCGLLIEGAYITRRRSYEYYALDVLGAVGKFCIEVFMILFLLCTLIAFFVVIGDLGPEVVHAWFGFSPESGGVRVFFMTAIALLVILPLSLLRNVDNLSSISSLAIIFYFGFVVYMFLLALPDLLSGDWILQISLWRVKGVLRCLPIFALSLSCQTQLFVFSDSLVEPSPARMNPIISGAVHLCSGVYALVGVFGYISFADGSKIPGDVLVLFDSSSLWTQFIKLAFLLSVAVSFPLMIFPCRTAIYNSLFRRDTGTAVIGSIPDGPFKSITFSLLAMNLLVAIFIPNVEFILGLTGSLIGSTVCFIFPAFLYLTVSRNQANTRSTAAKVCLLFGLFTLIACTYATVFMNNTTEHSAVKEMIETPLSNKYSEHSDTTHNNELVHHDATVLPLTEKSSISILASSTSAEKTIHVAKRAFTINESSVKSGE